VLKIRLKNRVKKFVLKNFVLKNNKRIINVFLQIKNDLALEPEKTEHPNYDSLGGLNLTRQLNLPT